MNEPAAPALSRRPSRWREAGLWLPILALACSVALLAPLAQPLLTKRVFVYNDLTWFHLPMRHLYQQALLAGDSLLWTPAIFSGFYFHGEGQTGVFHPLHLLLYRLLHLNTAFSLELIANYVGAFAGMVWFLRRLRFSPGAACTGAMLFAFSGFNLLHHHHLNMVAVVAHLPWLLAATDVVIADQRPWARRLAFAAIALLFGSAFLIGFPQSVWWDALALTAFALFRAWETGRWLALVPCAAAVLVGVLLGGIQIVPSADAAAHSIRAVFSRDFALSYSLHPINLFQLWSPSALRGGAHSARDFMWFHEFGIYSGALLPVSLIWVWLRRAALPARRALIGAATIGAIVALVLALGRYGGLATLVTYVPLLGSFRAPARYIVLWQFALAILAAMTIDDLLAIVDGRAAPPTGPMLALWTPAALGIGTTALLNGGLLPFGADLFSDPRTAAPGVAILVLVTALVFLAGRRARWALAAVVVVTAVDLGDYGLRFIYLEPPRTVPDLIHRVPPAPANPEHAYAIGPGGGLYRSDLLVLRGYRLTNGYVGLFPASRHPLDSPEALRLAGTVWTFTPEGRRLYTPSDVRRVRLLDETGREASGTARVHVDRPGRLVVVVDPPGPRIIALTERFHHGWTATAGGRPVEIVPVEGDFLGCVVGPSVRQVELTFKPRSFALGTQASAVGALLLAAVVVFWPARV